MSEENKSASNDSALAMVFKGLGRNLLLRGLVELVIGVMLLVAPARTARILTIAIGILLIADGVALFISSLWSKSSGRNWMVINAIALVVFGAIIICSPLLVDKWLVIVLGVWLIMSAVNELFSGGWRRLWGLLSSVLSLIIGVIFIALPFVGLAYIITVTGVVMIASGVFTFCAGLDLRSAGKLIGREPEPEAENKSEPEATQEEAEAEK